LSNLQIFTACVLIWGTTWLAITFQLGKVAPEASVFYRFFLASVLVFAYCLARRLPLRYAAREHGWIALMGILMFSVSYLFVYYAEQHVVSGLVAVGYSASPLLGMLGMRIFFGTPMTLRITAGSLLGIVGITLVFLPEFSKLQSGSATMLGAIYTALAVLLSALGSVVAQRNQRAQLPLWQSMAWGMYLAVFGSVVAFAGYLTLLHRIGAARSGYIGVMTPIVALVVSAAFEGFRWHVLTWLGIAVSVAGNVLILRGK
jgi:drug/metabolite transporter (DMT)-like permease